MHKISFIPKFDHIWNYFFIDYHYQVNIICDNGFDGIIIVGPNDNGGSSQLVPFMRYCFLLPSPFIYCSVIEWNNCGRFRVWTSVLLKWGYANYYAYSTIHSVTWNGYRRKWLLHMRLDFLAIGFTRTKRTGLHCTKCSWAILTVELEHFYTANVYLSKNTTQISQIYNDTTILCLFYLIAKM